MCNHFQGYYIGLSNADRSTGIDRTGFGDGVSDSAYDRDPIEGAELESWSMAPIEKTA